MFRITKDPYSENFVQYLVKNYKNGYIVSVDMDKVGVIAAYSNLLYVCLVHCMGRHQGGGGHKTPYIIMAVRYRLFATS